MIQSYVYQVIGNIYQIKELLYCSVTNVTTINLNQFNSLLKKVFKIIYSQIFALKNFQLILNNISSLLIAIIIEKNSNIFNKIKNYEMKVDYHENINFEK